MKKRILSMALVLCMLLAVLPPLGGVTVLADPAPTATENGDNVFDDLWVYGGKRDTDYSVSNDAGDYFLSILTDTPLTLKGRAGADKSVLVRCLADVTLAGVTFEGKFNFAGTLTLADGTVNRAERGVYVDDDFYTLTINGGELDTGKLIATGKENGERKYSGIGTNVLDPTKDRLTVTINGGIVVATGAKWTPGIGAMDYRVAALADPAGKTVVTVNGGTVVATGGEDAPGIGAGTSTSVSPTGEGHDGGDVELTVNGGCVIATGGGPSSGILGSYSPAGISGGAIWGRATPGNTTVTINGGTVTANGVDYGISGGYYSDTVKGQCTVTVNGGSLKSDAGIDATIQNSAGQPVYRHDIENPNGDAILIDGVLYPFAHTTAYNATTDTWTTEKKIYPYLPNADHTVVIGTTKYTYDSSWNLTATSTLTANPALTVTGGTAGRDYLYDDVADVFYILTNTLLTVESTDPTATVNHKITVLSAVANVKLGGDIAISNSLTVTGKMTLDLNGYVLKMTDTGKPVVKIEIGGNLTLKDSNPTAPHKFRIDNNLWVLDETNGTKTVTGGVITGAYDPGDRRAGGIYNDRGTLTMNGGNLVGNYGQAAGGVYNRTATFIMNGGSIVGNYGQAAGGVCNDYYENDATSGSSVQAVFTMNGGRIGSNAYFYAGVTNRYIFSIEDRTRAVFHANGGMIEDKVLNYNGTIDCEQGNGTVFTRETMNGNDPNFSDFYGTIRGGLYIGDVLLRKTELYDDTGNPHRENYISAITGGVFYGRIIPYSGGIISGGAFLGTGIDNESFTVTGTRHAITVHLGKNVTMYNRFLASTLNGTVIGDTLYYLGTPTRPCHEFDGWYTDADCTVPVDFTKPLTGDITVYAKWICTGHDFSKQYPYSDTLAFAGTCKDKATYYYTCSHCGEIEKDDTHTFEYALNPNIHTGILSDWQMDESKHWKVYTCCTDEVRYEATHNFVGGVCECGAVNYTVTFDANGGHVDTASATTDILGKLNTLPTPTRSADYRFDGWYTAKAGGNPVSGNTVLAADTTIYARWTDVAAPTGEIAIGTNRWRSFLNNITFGLFFKDTQQVTITAADNSGEAVTVEYLLSERELTETELATATFAAYTGAFTIEPNGAYVIYAKLTDKAGNVAYLNSDGVVLDNLQPVLSGVANGQVYCGAQVVTVSDTGAVTVTVNGEPVTLEGGQFTLAPAAGAQTVVVTDQAGNAVEITVTVNDGHTGGAADCAHKEVCSVCGDSYGEVDANAHLALTHIEAKAATAAAEGNTEYWHCAECDRYFSDRDGQNEIAAADTVIAKLPPNTGESRHTALWFALLFVSGGVLTGTVVCGKKKKRLSE